MSIPVVFGAEGSAVSELVYGGFIEHLQNCITHGVYEPGHALADERGFRLDVIDKVKQIAPPVVRFPGGTVMCLYHWQDAVGPQESRIRRLNRIWGGELDPGFGTAEFVAWCREVGAEPMICVNMASGTPEEAGNWVEYCNGTGDTYYAGLRRSHGYPDPFNVKYWCIGNECYAEPDIGLQNDVETYIREAREFIKWMKLTDRSIQTVIVGCDDMDWNRRVLDALHPMTDYFSYHHYSSEGEMGLYGPFAGERQLREALGRLSDLIDEYPETVDNFSPWYRFPPRQHKIRIALDEWNVWNADSSPTYGLDAVYNWRDAVWVASALNDILSCEAVGMANLAQLVNVIAPILTTETGSYWQTIAYPLLRCRRFMLGRRVEVSLDSPVLSTPAGEVEAISLCALAQDDGTLHLCAVNRDFERAHTIAPGGECRVLELTAPPRDRCTQDECCVSERTFTAQGEVTLAPGAVCLIERKR